MTTVKTLLDTIQLRVGQLPDSTAWQVQRPQVLTMVHTSLAMLDNEFRDRLRYVPNVLLEPAMRSTYEDHEGISAYHPPPDCDPAWITDLSALWSGIWHNVPKGITQSMRNNAYVANPTFSGWDIIECGQIEVWPHPTEYHKIRVSYTRAPSSYLEDDDCVDMDFQLLLMLTLDIALPRYKLPADEQAMNNRHLNRHLGNIRAKHLNGYRFNKSQVRGTNNPNSPDAADAIYSWPIHAN